VQPKIPHPLPSFQVMLRLLVQEPPFEWQGYKIPSVSIKVMEISDFGDVCPFLNFLLVLFTEFPFSSKLYSQQHYLFFKQEDC